MPLHCTIVIQLMGTYSASIEASLGLHHRPGLLSIYAAQEKSLLVSHVDAVPQAFHLQLLAGAAAVDILDIVRRGFEVAGSIVALG
jgi:hypothetical protein